MNNFYVDSSHFELVIVSGPDAERFLQGQLTCDVSGLATDAFTHGAACNNKGRVIAPFILTKAGTDFHLMFKANLGSLFLAALKKYLPFYKCSMHIDASQYTCFGLAGAQLPVGLQSLQAGIADSGHLSAIGSGWMATLDATNKQVLLCLKTSELTPEFNTAITSLTKDDGSRWQALEMQTGHYPFTAEDSEKHTPQELQYEKSAYISFSKGCYTGQEIVARMHYRGKVKKQLYLVEINIDTSPLLADLLLLDQDGARLAACTKVVQPDAYKIYALAVLPSDFTESNQIITSNQGTLVAIRPF